MQVCSTKLDSAEPGMFVCKEVSADGNSWIRMKSLGLCEGREFELVSRGDPMIIRVKNGGRIGLSRQLASFVSVTGSDENAS